MGLPLIAQESWTQLEDRRLNPPEIVSKIDSHFDIVYAHNGDQEMLLDLFQPKNRTEEPLPVIICIHGGGWAKGSKIHGRPIAQALAAR
ncbi:MAG: alpha/beta hydrolase, partial [Verrucomicrobiota bacterium]